MNYIDTSLDQRVEKMVLDTESKEKTEFVDNCS